MNLTQSIWFNGVINLLEKMDMSSNDCKHFINFLSNVDIKGTIIYISNGKVVTSDKRITSLHKFTIMEFYYKFQELSEDDQNKLKSKLKWHGLEIVHLDSKYVKFEKYLTVIGLKV